MDMPNQTAPELLTADTQAPDKKPWIAPRLMLLPGAVAHSWKVSNGEESVNSGVIYGPS